MATEFGHLSLQVIDGNRVPKSIQYFYATASGLLADMLSMAGTFIPLVDAVTQSQIVKADLVLPLTLPGGLKSAPVASSNNEIGGLVDFDLSGDAGHYGLWTPNFIPAGFSTVLPTVIDQTQTDVAAYLAALLGTTDTTKFIDFYGFDLSSVRSAIKSVRKQRRAMGRIR